MMLGGCVAKPMHSMDVHHVTGSQWKDQVEAMSSVRLDGLVQLDYKDEDGRHRVQGDMDLLLDEGTRSSVRITKASELILWGGQTGSDAWMIDFTEMPPRYSGRRQAGSGSLIPDAMVLRLLLAMEVFPDESVRIQGQDEILVRSIHRIGGEDAEVETRFDLVEGRPNGVVVTHPLFGTWRSTHHWTTGQTRLEGTQGRPLARVVDVIGPDETVVKINTVHASIPGEAFLLSKSHWFDPDQIAAHYGAVEIK